MQKIYVETWKKALIRESANNNQLKTKNQNRKWFQFMFGPQHMHVQMICDHNFRSLIVPLQTCCSAVTVAAAVATCCCCSATGCSASPVAVAVSSPLSSLDFFDGGGCCSATTKGELLPVEFSDLLLAESTDEFSIETRGEFTADERRSARLPLSKSSLESLKL